MRFEFHPEARGEYLAAVAYYESRQVGLGSRFTAEIESTIQRILESKESVMSFNNFCFRA